MAVSGIGGTRAVASVFGLCVGISGLDHGSFETLQGNAPTNGLIVQAIGPGQRLWVHGTEEAFTILPTFLAAGILTLAVAVAVIVWSIRFIDRPNGSRVFLGLSLLLFLAGGGVAMLVPALLGWAVARRIGRPVRWPLALPGAIGRGLARAWPALLAVALGLYAFAIEVAVAGVVPGVSDPEQILLICWLSLLAMLTLMVGALAGGSIYDLAEAREPGRVPAAA